MKNKLKRLIKNHCACYLGDQHDIKHYCCSVDATCVFFNHEEASCSYFEKGVLPLDEQLEFEYKTKRNMEVDKKKPKRKGNCKSCGQTFLANSNRQMYCEICKVLNEKEKAKLRMRKMRENEFDVTV